MARALRLDVENGWYHVTSRGIERRSIFVNEAEHAHFLELLGDMVGRFRVRHRGIGKDQNLRQRMQTVMAKCEK